MVVRVNVNGVTRAIHSSVFSFIYVSSSLNNSDDGIQEDIKRAMNR